MIKYAIKGKDKAPPSGLLGKAAEKFPEAFKSKASADDEDMDEEEPDEAPEADADDEDSSPDAEACMGDLFAAMDNHDLKKGAMALEAFIKAMK